MSIRSTVLLSFLLLGCSAAIAGSHPPRPHHVESFTGEVLIDSKGSHVVVLVDTNNGGRDGFVDQWFTLQTDGPPAPISLHLTTAKISHARGVLRVLSPELRTAYDFVLPGEAVELDTPQGFIVTRFEGYGLAHNHGASSVHIPNVHRDGITSFDCEGCEVVYPCDGCDGGGSGAVSCEAGGAGASSCSISSGTKSCTVTCTSSYRACCNTTATGVSCRCIAGS